VLICEGRAPVAHALHSENRYGARSRLRVRSDDARDLTMPEREPVTVEIDVEVAAMLS
jgi:hypothetical protein